ncbi:MAG: peptidase U32 family protein, partial [Kofleriaceae bacterium]
MRRPEVLAPAGDRDALAAALAAGADAVYLGLDDGFNARARAVNFASDTLPELVAWIHRAGARLYVTLNTLVFEPELPIVEQLIRRVAAAGTDAIIVQDPAVALIARATCPALEVHASTQMTASSPLAVTLLAPLGLSRVVVPRELSVDEIRAYAAASPVPLEVFVHGALCVAWSGQCLSSEAWGGRSANRGQCAQACRLPYSLVVDGAVRDLGEVEYLLSPKDLVGTAAIPALTEIGVASFKIEGRLKGPHYVATTVAHYRNAIAHSLGLPTPSTPTEIPDDDASLHVAYSRGISPGFLSGANHQSLVEGRFPRHRGLPLGRVVKVDRDAVFVVPDAAQRPNTGGLAIDTASSSGASSSGASSSGASSSGASSSGASSSGASSSGASSVSAETSPAIAPRAGMGVVFDAGRPEETEQGGPIFSVDAIADGYRLRFGTPGPDLSRVGPGDFVWISSDPRVTRAGEKAADAGRTALGRIPVELVVRGAVGVPLEVTARAVRATSAETRALAMPATSAESRSTTSSSSASSSSASSSSASSS